MISTIAMAAILSAWFYKIYVVAATGVLGPFPPMTMLVMAIICAALEADRIHRRLS